MIGQPKGRSLLVMSQQDNQYLNLDSMGNCFIYKSGMVNLKSFVSKDFLRNKWKYELTMYFKHEMIRKHFTETSNKVELRIKGVFQLTVPDLYL